MRRGDTHQSSVRSLALFAIQDIQDSKSPFHSAAIQIFSQPMSIVVSSRPAEQIRYPWFRLFSGAHPGCAVTVQPRHGVSALPQSWALLLAWGSSTESPELSSSPGSLQHRPWLPSALLVFTQAAGLSPRLVSLGLFDCGLAGGVQFLIEPPPH
jgi:hypothetical protein